MARRVAWTALGVVVLLGFRMAQSFVAFKNEDTVMQVLSTEAERYAGLASLPDAGTEPYVAGKLLTIDVEKRAVDFWTYSKLPQELKAMDPSDIGTVALITWGWKLVGDYVDHETREKTGEAYRSTADVALVDVNARVVVARQSFDGDDPAGGLTREGDYRSERPMFKVLAYLERLPRK